MLLILTKLVIFIGSSNPPSTAATASTTDTTRRAEGGEGEDTSHALGARMLMRLLRNGVVQFGTNEDSSTEEDADLR